MQDCPVFSPVGRSASSQIAHEDVREAGAESRPVRERLECSAMRVGTVKRETKETQIEVTIDLDGTGKHDVQTPLPFLTHMVEQLGRHGLFDLTVRATGDIEIDGHHTTEDLGITVGQAVAK